MTLPDVGPVKNPAQIHTELLDGLVRLSIHTLDGIAAANLCPADAYAIARYIQWLNEPGAHADSPNHHAPLEAGVWGEYPEDREIPTAAMIVVLGEGDDRPTSIQLDLGRAGLIAKDLVRKAVAAVGMGTL